MRTARAFQAAQRPTCWKATGGGSRPPRRTPVDAQAGYERVYRHRGAQRRPRPAAEVVDGWWQGAARAQADHRVRPRRRRARRPPISTKAGSEQPANDGAEVGHGAAKVRKAALRRASTPSDVEAPSAKPAVAAPEPCRPATRVLASGLVRRKPPDRAPMSRSTRVAEGCTSTATTSSPCRAAPAPASAGGRGTFAPPPPARARALRPRASSSGARGGGEGVGQPGRRRGNVR